MRSVWAVALLLVLLAGCTAEPDLPADADVLARAGDAVVTAEEFRLNYEFGYGHLRAGADPRRDLLDFMLREKMLAQEAERMGLDTAAAVRHALHTLREELLIERVFETFVLDSITVSDEEIRQEVGRTAVRFRFRFLPALNEDDAWALREDLLARGWDDVFEERKRRFAEIRTAEGEMTSPYVSADEVEPGLLEAIRDLPVQTPSEPVLQNGRWYVFEVMDVRREPVDDYADRASSARKVVYNRKAMEGGARFVAETMTPLDVVTRRAGFEALNEALRAWYTDDQPVRNLLHYIEEQGLDTDYTRLLVAHYDAPLVRFGDEEWTVRTFLEHFTPGRYTLRARDPRAFKARLADVVALVVRDHIFLDLAERHDLADDPTYRRTLALWKEKWLFQELRDRLRARSDAPARTLLTRFADSVDANYDVFVNETMLDTLTLSVSEVNPTMTVHLFKSNSNKMPFPITDPNWKVVP